MENNRPVISITSWKARINTVGVTIYSLLRFCPDFHIILTLSKLEFPEQTVPHDLELMSSRNLLEIAWVDDNPKEFKKLNAFKLYPNNPCVFVDDDMFYTTNFVNELYSIWQTQANSVISYTNTHTQFGCCMACTLFPPSVFSMLLNAMETNHSLHDDALFPKIFMQNNINVIGLYDKFPGFFHDETLPLNGSDNISAWKSMQQFL